MSWSLLLASLVIEASVLESLSTSVFFLAHKLEKLLDNDCKIALPLKVTPFEGSDLLGFVLLKVGFVDGFLDLDLTDFFDLIMVNYKGLAIEHLVAQTHFRVQCRIRNFETHKRKAVAILVFVESNLLNFAKLLENLSKIILAPALREVLDVKVASLLGALVFVGFLSLLCLSVFFLESVPNVQFVSVELLVLEGFDCLCCTFWSVVFTLAVGVVVADKAELANRVFHENN